MSRQSKTKPVIATLVLGGLLGAAAAALLPSPHHAVSATAMRPVALPVETDAIIPQDSFAMQRTFSGRVQAKRQTALGFELAGRLAEVFVDEGDVVEAGRLLAQLDTARLQASRAELIAARAEAEARLALADVTLQRTRGVVDRGGVSRQDLDEAREALRAASATLALADQRIATIDIELGKTRLIAPFNATVIRRDSDEGRVLEAGHPVLTLQERGAPEIRIGIAGRTLDRLEPGRVYPATWRGQHIAARLRALLPVRAATARTVDALFDPVDPPDGMLPGDMVTLTLESEITQPGSWLPLGALTEGQRGLWSVYIAEPLVGEDADLTATHRIVRRTVDVLYQSADRVFVQGALRPDQRVVISGLHRIVPDQPVRLARDAAQLAEIRHD